MVLTVIFISSSAYFWRRARIVTICLSFSAKDGEKLAYVSVAANNCTQEPTSTLSLSKY